MSESLSYTCLLVRRAMDSSVNKGGWLWIIVRASMWRRNSDQISGHEIVRTHSKISQNGCSRLRWWHKFSKWILIFDFILQVSRLVGNELLPYSEQMSFKSLNIRCIQAAEKSKSLMHISREKYVPFSETLPLANYTIQMSIQLLFRDWIKYLPRMLPLIVHYSNFHVRKAVAVRSFSDDDSLIMACRCKCSLDVSTYGHVVWVTKIFHLRIFIALSSHPRELSSMSPGLILEVRHSKWKRNCLSRRPVDTQNPCQFPRQAPDAGTPTRSLLIRLIPCCAVHLFLPVTC